MARQRAAEANEILAKVELRAGLSTIGFDDMLCDATRCRTTLGSQHLYLDNSHLSIGGGEVLIRELMIGERIEKAAS